MKIHKPSFNSYIGKLELIHKNIKLKKEVTGWILAMKDFDQDFERTLKVGTEVTVWRSAKTDGDLIITKLIEIKGKLYPFEATIEAKIKK